MLGTYSDSVSTGTLSNRFTQVKTYVTFAVYYGFEPLCPSSTELCMYVQYLKNSFAAPSTIKNYLSGSKMWISEHGGDLTGFSTFEYHQLTSGLNRRSQHVPIRAAPLTWDHIRTIASFLDATPNVPSSAKVCLLVGFYTFLRSGNLLSPTITSWGGAHTLLARDIWICDQGLHVSIRTTKTKKHQSPLTTIIPWQDDPLVCPASAWHRYQEKIKPWILGPAFLTDNGLPLTPRHLVGFMRLALQDSKDIDPGRVSMHSLRRGAAQSAVAAGVDIDTVKHLGMWKSDSGLAPYLL